MVLGHEIGAHTGTNNINMGKDSRDNHEGWGQGELNSKQDLGKGKAKKLNIAILLLGSKQKTNELKLEDESENVSKVTR